jgi:transcriptional regulator with XRE-family HTH domain
MKEPKRMTMTKRGALDKYVRTPDDELAFAEETAMAQAALAVAELLASTGMTQRMLAERIGVTEARISQILGADSNPTVRTMARIGRAMGRRAVVEFRAPPVSHERVEPWPRRLRSIPLQWERSNEEPEEAVETGCAA